MGNRNFVVDFFEPVYRGEFSFNDQIISLGVS